MKYNYLFSLLIGLLTQLSVTSQTSTSDSLERLSYDDIENNIKTSKTDSIKRIHAEVYLSKAKKEKNLIHIAEGYNFLSEANSHTLKGLSYADSIIATSSDLKHETYPAQGYLQKGIQLYYLAEHKEALENYLKAFSQFENSNNEYGKVAVNHYIGLLKNSIKERDEAFKLFKDNLIFFENKENQKKYNRQYLKSLFALVDSYNGKRDLDLAEEIGKKGLKESLKNENKYLYSHFLLAYGATKVFKEEYSIALDSLIKASKLLKNEKKVIAGSFSAISLAYSRSNDKKNALVYLNKIDSLYQKNPEVIAQAKSAYESLIKNHQQENNLEEQLVTIKKLLKVDSILTEKNNRLGKSIVKKYETPLLISEKERLIRELKNNSNSNRKIILLLVVISLLIALVMGYVLKKNRTYKKRFNQLLSNQTKKIERFDEPNELAKTDYDFPEELFNEIVQKLTIFESSDSFTRKQYTLVVLAKELNTNSSYLSKVINMTKSVNFSNYLNNLKIEYAIEKLKESKHLRSYTIKAIAEEVGFNNAQSFTNAFKKKTGLFPSYFIKQLNKQT